MSPARRPKHTWGSEKTDDSALRAASERSFGSQRSFVSEQRDGHPALQGGRAGGSPRTRTRPTGPAAFGSERSAPSLGSPRLPSQAPYPAAAGAFEWPSPSPATTSSDATTGVGQWSAGPASPDPRYYHAGPALSPKSSSSSSTADANSPRARTAPPEDGPPPHSPREQRLRHLLNLIMDVQRR